MAPAVRLPPPLPAGGATLPPYTRPLDLISCLRFPTIVTPPLCAQPRSLLLSLLSYAHIVFFCPFPLSLCIFLSDLSSSSFVYIPSPSFAPLPASLHGIIHQTRLLPLPNRLLFLRMIVPGRSPEEKQELWR